MCLQVYVVYDSNDFVMKFIFFEVILRVDVMVVEVFLIDYCCVMSIDV